MEYPSVKSEVASGSNVAVKVNLKNGNCDLILSSDANTDIYRTENVETKSTYSICRTKEGSPVLVFMGNGTYYKGSGVEIKTSVPGDVLLYSDADGWKYTSSVDSEIMILGKSYKLEKTANSGVIK